MYPKWAVQFHTKIFCAFIFPMRATYSHHLMFLDLAILMVLEYYKL